MSSNQIMPRSIPGLHVNRLEGESLIYVFATHAGISLNAVAARVFDRCDGLTLVSQVARELESEFHAEEGEQLVWLALEELHRGGLITELPARVAESSRRRFLQMAPLLVPVLSAIVVPPPAAAASRSPQPTPSPSPGVS